MYGHAYMGGMLGRNMTHKRGRSVFSLGPPSNLHMDALMCDLQNLATVFHNQAVLRLGVPRDISNHADTYHEITVTNSYTE